MRWELLARVADLPAGTMLGVQTSAGERICLFNHDGRIGAVSDVCSHQEFAMSAGTLLPDGSIECAWHGAEFDAATGAVRRGPATEPLTVFPVDVRDGGVYVATRR